MSDHHAQVDELPVARRRLEGHAAACFVAAAVAAVLVIVGGFVGWSFHVLGVLGGVALGAAGIGLVLWADAVMDAGPLVQRREPLAGTALEEAGLVSDIERGPETTRPVLRRTVLGAGIAIGAAALLPVRTLGPKPGKQLLHTTWHDGVRVVNGDGQPVRVDDVPLDGLFTVFPEGAVGSAEAQTVLVRVRPELLDLPPGRRSWAVEGIVAYSKVCSHAGCPVGLYQAKTHELLCPCHQSTFDVLRAAKPGTGPAAWPLPQLPLRVDGSGVLVAGGDFSEPVGPGWWKA